MPNTIHLPDFESLRKRDDKYIDKTRLIHKLVKTGKYYFLSRPDGFGKSMLLSTLKAYFEGKSELFQGLTIERLEQVWNKFPVLLLNLGNRVYSSVDDLYDILNVFLTTWEDRYGIQHHYKDYELRLLNVIDTIHAKMKSKVVVLIDDYDKPIMDALYDIELKEKVKNILQSFYGVLKARDGIIEFCLMTGISKIGDPNVFGGFNSMYDISMSESYANICGITKEELRRDFDNEVSELGKTYGLNKEECHERLAELYGGYHFCEGSTDLFNTYCLIDSLQNRKFIESMDYLPEIPEVLSDIIWTSIHSLQHENNRITLSCCALRDSRDLGEFPLSLSYRTGLLTIKEYDKEFNEYHLGFPNDEVMRHIFLNSDIPNQRI